MSDAPLDFEQEKAFLIKSLTVRISAAEQQIEQAQNALKHCLEWKNLQHEAKMLQAFQHQIKPGMHEVTLPDWEQDNAPKKISLDPNQSLADELEKRFHESKRRRRGIEKSELFLKRAQQSLEFQKKLLAAATQADSLESLQKLIPQQKKRDKKTQPTDRVRYRRYYSDAKIEIFVGKKATDNDYLTFQIANGNDWWLHVHQYPGSHVVIRHIQPDDETIRDALQLALHFSKAKDEAEIVITQRKFVSRSGQRKAGQVYVSKHKTIYAKLDYPRLQKVLHTIH